MIVHCENGTIDLLPLPYARIEHDEPIVEHAVSEHGQATFALLWSAHEPASRDALISVIK